MQREGDRNSPGELGNGSRKGILGVSNEFVMFKILNWR